MYDLLVGREFLVKTSCGVPSEGHSNYQQQRYAQQTTQAFHTETSLIPFLYHKWKPRITPMTGCRIIPHSAAKNVGQNSENHTIVIDVRSAHVVPYLQLFTSLVNAADWESTFALPIKSFAR
ncbi:MAG: hypothetical protein AUG08_07575 [Acidobacteria bacterium 13_1_20CM_2_55_15]|nr:MAG: hypothetical protein AUG08_07575 [Acidobacteria bacterium 13_1_20CM_2_55_15]